MAAFQAAFTSASEAVGSTSRRSYQLGVAGAVFASVVVLIGPPPRPG